jgi:hypothetical protein
MVLGGLVDVGHGSPSIPGTKVVASSLWLASGEPVRVCASR